MCGCQHARTDREPPVRRSGPAARQSVKAEKRGATLVRGYARAMIAEIRRAVLSVPLDAEDRDRKIRRAVAAARRKIRRQWPTRALREILDELIENGRRLGLVQARATIKRSARGDAVGEQLSLPGPPTRMARKELPERRALESVDDVISRVRLTGTGDGMRALRRLQTRTASWIVDEVEGTASAPELEVGFSRAIDKVLGRADLIGSEETARSAAQSVRAALLSVGTGYYRWETQQDDAVRDAHIERQSKIFTWETGSGESGDEHPGDAINCRCWAEPVTRADLIAEGIIPADPSE